MPVTGWALCNLVPVKDMVVYYLVLNARLIKGAAAEFDSQSLLY